MNKLIVANWKMNVLPSESVKFVKDLEKIDIKDEVIVLAPYIDLPYLRSDKIKFGAQNVHYKDRGSYTGEISVDMLKDININYCLIGHQERRKNNKENDSLIELKVRYAINNNMNVILCVNSVKTLLKDIKGLKNYKNLIIAYEPAGNIGTSKIASIKDIAKFSTAAKRITNNEAKVIYGGGINNSNISAIKNIDIIDGIMIGNSSININEFKEIVSKY